MSVTEAKTRKDPEAATRLVRVEVEVPEDAVESLLAYAASMRGEPLPKAKDFKEFLTAAPAWTNDLVELVNDRDKRAARDIDL